MEVVLLLAECLVGKLCKESADAPGQRRNPSGPYEGEGKAERKKWVGRGVE